MKKGLFRNNMVYFVLFSVIAFQTFDCFYADVISTDNVTYSQSLKNNIVFSGYKDLTEPTEEELLTGKTNKEIFEYYVHNQKYIMHAGGSIDGINYTNSYEALEENYKNGNRIFEIDLNFTADGYLALLHGWTEYDYQKRLGAKFDPNKPIMDLHTFKNTLLHNKYHSMSLKDLITFMKKHPYAYFILNLKNGSRKKVTAMGLKQLVKTANYDANILNRFIIWGYNINVISIAKNIYDFELITLSYNDPKTMPYKVNSKEKIISYCIKENITSLIYSVGSFNSEMAKEASMYGIHSFVFTIDNELTAQNYLHNGATMILSNKLTN